MQFFAVCCQKLFGDFLQFIAFSGFPLLLLKPVVSYAKKKLCLYLWFIFLSIFCRHLCKGLFFCNLLHFPAFLHWRWSRTAPRQLKPGRPFIFIINTRIMTVVIAIMVFIVTIIVINNVNRSLVILSNFSLVIGSVRIHSRHHQLKHLHRRHYHLPPR